MSDLLKQVDQPQDDSTRLIPLTRGQFAIVDAADYEWLMQWKWVAQWQPSNQSFYVQRSTPKIDGKRGFVSMHRLILGLSKGVIGDHINRNTLDNRRVNLRPATHSQNSQNKSLNKNSVSGYKGVCYRKDKNKYQARIHIDGKKHSLGYFHNAKDAAIAYNRAASGSFGEFAVLNDI